MNKLSPEARHLIEAARTGQAPPAQARDRVRARVLARVGAAAAVGSAVAFGSSSAVAKPAAAGILLKLAAFVGIASVAAAVTVGVDTRYGSGATLAPPPSAVPASLPVARPARLPAPPPSAEVAPPPTTPPAAPRPPAPRVSAAPPPGSSSLDSEIALLHKAQAELRAGHPEKALAALDARGGAPGGVLRDERRAERILALCAAGRTAEARAEAQRFLAESPRTPMAARVRSSCAGQGDP